MRHSSNEVRIFIHINDFKKVLLLKEKLHKLYLCKFILGCDGRMDVVFVLDSSGSIGGEHFETTKSFVINTIDVLDIERDLINVGFVQFSSTVTGKESTN